MASTPPLLSCTPPTRSGCRWWRASKKTSPCWPPPCALALLANLLKTVFTEGADRVEVWDYDHFDSWETLDWPEVRVLRYRQQKRDGSIVQAEWLTDFPIAKLGSLSFYRLAKSRWEIENHGFNDGKNRYGMEHICHHDP